MLSMILFVVSTHSRLKAAGAGTIQIRKKTRVSTHSRLKAAGDDLEATLTDGIVSTHSRLKAAGYVGARCALLV